MKMQYFFTLMLLLFVTLSEVSARSRYSRVVCPYGYTPVAIAGGWQCAEAEEGEPSEVFPQGRRRPYSVRRCPESDVYEREYESDYEPEELYDEDYE